MVRVTFINGHAHVPNMQFVNVKGNESRWFVVYVGLQTNIKKSRMDDFVFDVGNNVTTITYSSICKGPW